MSGKQFDDINVLDVAGDDRPDDRPEIRPNPDLGVVTSQPRGPGLAQESVPKDITMDLDTGDADATTPAQEQTHRLGPQNGARPKPFSFGLPTPVTRRLPPLTRAQPGADFLTPQQTDLTADLLDTMARLRTEVYGLKLEPPFPPTPADEDG